MRTQRGASSCCRLHLRNGCSPACLRPHQVLPSPSRLGLRSVRRDKQVRVPADADLDHIQRLIIALQIGDISAPAGVARLTRSGHSGFRRGFPGRHD